MPVRVGVVAEGHAIPVLELDEARHGMGAGAIHPDFPVVVQRHEPKRGIDPRIHHGDIQAVDFIDPFPVMDRRAAQRVHAQRQAGAADCLHVNHVAQVVDVGQDEIFLMRARCL